MTDPSPAEVSNYEKSLGRANGVRRFRRIARTGYSMNGLIHFIIGGTAIAVAFGDTSVSSADQAGALQQLGSNPIGRILLWSAVVGLLTLGIWQVTRAVIQIDHPSFATRLGKRIVEVGKGVVYLVLGSTTLIFALGGSSSDARGIRTVTGLLLESDVGISIVVIIGLTAAGIGIGFASIGLRRTFTKLIRLPMNRGRRSVLILGVTGYVAKGVALVIVGGIFVAAAITGDPDRASGLDGALRSLLVLPLGSVLLTAMGVGLIQFGLFLVARSRLALL